MVYFPFTLSFIFNFYSSSHPNYNIKPMVELAERPQDWHWDGPKTPKNWALFLPISHEHQLYGVASGFTRLIMPTKYVCHGLSSPHVNFHDNPSMWTVTLIRTNFRWGGGGGENENSQKLNRSNSWTGQREGRRPQTTITTYYTETTRIRIKPTKLKMPTKRSDYETKICDKVATSKLGYHHHKHSALVACFPEHTKAINPISKLFIHCCNFI